MVRNDKYIISTNPAKNYEPIGKVKASSKEEIQSKIFSANSSKANWGNLDMSTRIKYVKKMLYEFKNREADVSTIITKEIGTPITECRDEVSWDWDYFQWFIENVEKSISPEVVFENNNSIHKLLFEPTGSVAVITPWNLPFDMFIWGVIPNLLVGNTVIYKAAEECVLSEKLFEEIVKNTGLPEGVLNFVYGDGVEGKTLSEGNIDMIWFTGSSDVGKSIFQTAGKKFIKSILEMGGSNPAVVFEDADLDKAVDVIISKRFMFSGQTCDADKRIIVHKSVYKEFMKKFKSKVGSIIVGNPDDEKTQMGPLVSEKQLKHLELQVNDAVKKGATIVSGAKRPDGSSGAYYLPTILTNITKEMKVWKEEVFGPVVPVVVFTREDEAVEMANDTLYGLGSQVFTNDLKKAERVSIKIKAGNVDVNGVGHFKPYNPFGGYKMSGMGREHGVLGFRELCQVKVVSSNR